MRYGGVARLRPAAVLLLCLVATSAVAQQRPFSPKLSCQSLKQLVASAGAVLIGTGPRTFDRFVSSRRFCAVTEVTDPAWIPSADTPQCFVGYTCREYDPDRFP